MSETNTTVAPAVEPAAPPAAAAPEPTPAPAPVATPKGDDGKEPTASEWESLATHEDQGEGDEPAPAPAAPAPTPAKPVEAPPIAAAPKPAPAVAQPPAPAPAAVVAPQPAQPVAQSPAAQPVAAPAEPVIDEKKLAEIRDNTLKQLEPFYEMSDAEEELFQTDPRKYFKSAGAQLQLRTYEMTFNAIASQLPRMIREITQRDSTYSSLEQQFFTKFDDLKPHADQVAAIARYVKQTHPALATEERMEIVGNMARAQLRIPPPAPKPAPVTPAPAAPGARRVVATEPYMPAAPGAAAAAPAPKNEWQALAEHEDFGED